MVVRTTTAMDNIEYTPRLPVSSRARRGAREALRKCRVLMLAAFVEGSSLDIPDTRSSL